MGKSQDTVYEWFAKHCVLRYMPPKVCCNGDTASRPACKPVNLANVGQLGV